MKKASWVLLVGIVFMYSGMIGLAYADATFADPAAVGAVVVNPEAADPVHQVLNAVMALIVTGLTALLGWVATNVKTWIAQKASEANTKESAAWYSTALNLAGIAVKIAETKFGPDSEKGAAKKAEAVSWLKGRLMAIDPKLKISDSDLAGFVDAAYHDVFVAVSPLVGSPAQK